MQHARAIPANRSRCDLPCRADHPYQRAALIALLLTGCTLPPDDDPPAQAEWAIGCSAWSCPGASRVEATADAGSCWWECASYGFQTGVAVSLQVERIAGCWVLEELVIEDGDCSWLSY